MLALLGTSRIPEAVEPEKADLALNRGVKGSLVTTVAHDVTSLYRHLYIEPISDYAKVT